MILRIAMHELRLLFRSPIAYATLAVVQAVLAYLFLIQIERFIEWQPHLPKLPGAPGVTALVAAPLLKSTALVLALVVPALTMRLVSEERSRGTLALLLSAPVSMAQIVIGKFAGVMAFVLLLLGLIALMPLSLLLGASLDAGLLAAGLIGLVLLGASFVSAGLFVSTLTTQPSVAATGTLGLLLLLWVLEWSGSSGAGLLAHLSLTAHLDRLLRGVFDTRDVVYPVLFSACFLGLSVLRMHAIRGR